MLHGETVPFPKEQGCIVYTDLIAYYPKPVAVIVLGLVREFLKWFHATVDPRFQMRLSFSEVNEVACMVIFTIFLCFLFFSLDET